MKEVKVYTPNSMRDAGVRIWKTMFMELLAVRELMWRLVYRDIAVRYRQSILGYMWSIIPPVITVAIFTFLANKRVLPIDGTILPYPVYALWSIGIWQLFSQSLLACTNSLVNAGSLVTKANFPKEALIIASVGQPLFDFMIRLLPVIVVFYWFDTMPSLLSVFMPVVLLPLIFLAIGMGFFLAIANLVIRDIGNVVGILLTFGMFTAPVLYPPPVTEPFFLVNIINPLSPLLIASQELLAGAPISRPDMFFAAILFSFSMAMLGWRFFNFTLQRIVERA